MGASRDQPHPRHPSPKGPYAGRPRRCLRSTHYAADGRQARAQAQVQGESDYDDNFEDGYGSDDFDDTFDAEDADSVVAAARSGDGADLERAAQRVQSMQRGRIARAEVKRQPKRWMCLSLGRYHLIQDSSEGEMMEYTESSQNQMELLLQHLRTL